MRYSIPTILAILLCSPGGWTWGASATPTPWPLIKEWKVGAVPWDLWFKDNTVVTDKGDYVHFFWNAEDFKRNFEGKEREGRLGEAARELAARLFPKEAKADRVKVDIVFVKERDSYGMPKWSSLKRVAHLEFKRPLESPGTGTASPDFEQFKLY